MVFLKEHVENPDFEFIRLDLLDPEGLKTTVKDADAVFHLAANPDVRLGVSDTRVHLEQKYHCHIQSS